MKTEQVQKECSIYQIKIGTAVTRMNPAKSLPPMPDMFTGQMVERCGDRSYMGDKLIFMGIANGQIYLERTGTEKDIFGDKLIDLSLDLWDEGWVEFIDPKTLAGNNYFAVSKKKLQQMLKKAEIDEDYELASKLKKAINKTLTNEKHNARKPDPNDKDFTLLKRGQQDHRNGCFKSIWLLEVGCENPQYQGNGFQCKNKVNHY
jgi:hypothetical protein